MRLLSRGNVAKTCNCCGFLHYDDGETFDMLGGGAQAAKDNTTTVHLAEVLTSFRLILTPVRRLDLLVAGRD